MDIDSGPVAWQSSANHNRMMELQRQGLAEPGDPSAPGRVELAYFGSSAFQVTSPRGVTVMLDPWRNHPSRSKD